MADIEFAAFDVSDVGLEDEEEEEEEQPVEEVEEEVVKGRGADLYMEEYAEFKDLETFKAHPLHAELAKEFTKRKTWEIQGARKESYVCKYSQRRGYKTCRRQYMVMYPDKDFRIIIFDTCREEHVHEEDPNFKTNTNYHWTKEQEAIVLRGIQTNTKNSLILEQLKIANAVNGTGKFPDGTQVGAKKRYMKNVTTQDKFVFNSGDLRIYCESNSATPTDENKSFVAFFYIEGNNPAELNMTVIWTTPKLLSRMSTEMIQDDATYKCNWYQYPLFVAGRSTPTGRFYQTHLALSSHEDSAAWIRIHAWVRSVLPRMPRFAMADGAAEITKSLREVFGLYGIGDGETLRLMCWPHTYRNYSKQLAPIKKINKKLAKDVDNDIQNIQWMVQSEEEFSKVFLLLEEKYLDGDYTEEELQKLKVFFSYFRKQWGPGSPVFRWFEGANPYHCSNNMGLEKRNDVIKSDFSFRKQLNMSQFISVMEKESEHFSKRDDSILHGSRLDILTKDEDGKQERDHLKIQTSGHKYYSDHLKALPESYAGEPPVYKPGKIAKIGKASIKDCRLLSQNPGMEMGEVKGVFGLPSKSNMFTHKPLMSLLTDRLRKRAKPEFSTLQEYYTSRTSCCIVEQIGREFYCDCRMGMKGKLCDEVMGLTYLLVPQFKVHKSIDTVNFKRARRPVGRPRDIEGALSRVVPRALEERSYQRTGLEVEQVEEVVLDLQEGQDPQEGGQEELEEVQEHQEVQETQQGSHEPRGEVQVKVCTVQYACEEEDKKKAESKCDECPDYLCEDCGKVHGKNKRTKHHTATVLPAFHSPGLVSLSLSGLAAPGLSGVASTSSRPSPPAPASPVISVAQATVALSPLASLVSSSLPVSAPAAPKPSLTSQKSSAPKCRALYGMEGKDKWCKPCKVKKKCIGSSQPTSQVPEKSSPEPKEPQPKRSRRNIGL